MAYSTATISEAIAARTQTININGSGTSSGETEVLYSSFSDIPTSVGMVWIKDSSGWPISLNIQIDDANSKILIKNVSATAYTNAEITAW